MVIVKNLTAKKVCFFYKKTSTVIWVFIIFAYEMSNVSSSCRNCQFTWKNCVLLTFTTTNAPYLFVFIVKFAFIIALDIKKHYTIFHFCLNRILNWKLPVNLHNVLIFFTYMYIFCYFCHLFWHFQTIIILNCNAFNFSNVFTEL